MRWHYFAMESGTAPRDSAKGPIMLEDVATLNRRMAVMEQLVQEIHEFLKSERCEKEWYSTTDAAAFLGKSQFTIQEKWCNQGRIECEKDPNSGKWRIPGHEIRRLKQGGSLLPRK